MRIAGILSLLVALGLSACSGPARSVATMTQLAENPTVGSFAEAAGTSVLGPDPAQQPVRPEDVRREPLVYAATLPVLDDVDGAVRLRVTVNLQAQTIEATEGIFAPHLPAVSYRQLGEGIGKYEPTTGRYYFNVGYQKVRRLADGRTDSGALQEISGWVRPEDSSAAVVSKAVL